MTFQDISTIEVELPLLILIYPACWLWFRFRDRVKEQMQQKFGQRHDQNFFAHEVAADMLATLAPHVPRKFVEPTGNIYWASVNPKTLTITVMNLNSIYHLTSGMHEAGHLIDCVPKGKKQKWTSAEKALRVWLLIFPPFLLIYCSEIDFFNSFARSESDFTWLGLIMFLLKFALWIMFLATPVLYLSVIIQEASAWTIASKYNKSHRITPNKEFQHVRNSLFSTYWDPFYRLGLAIEQTHRVCRMKNKLAVGEQQK